MTSRNIRKKRGSLLLLFCRAFLNINWGTKNCHAFALFQAQKIRINNTIGYTKVNSHCTFYANAPLKLLEFHPPYMKMSIWVNLLMKLIYRNSGNFTRITSNIWIYLFLLGVVLKFSVMHFRNEKKDDLTLSIHEFKTYLLWCNVI